MIRTSHRIFATARSGWNCLCWPCSQPARINKMARRSIYDHCRLLGKDSIRLLQIERTSPVPVLSLHPYRIAEAPAFTALSYTWGNPLPPLAPGKDAYNENVKCFLTSEHVECNVNVTRNLFDALCALASKSINGPLWIDALCIDQGSNDERQEQVAMMGQIYASSQEVIVWLGPTSELDKDAVTLHNEFVPALKRHFGGSIPGPEELKALSLSKLLELGLLSDPQALKSYEWFRRRAWFQRAWTFQEVFLAHRINLLYDDQIIEWSNLMDLAFYELNLHETVTTQGHVPEAHQLGMPTSLRRLENLRATFGIGSQDNAIRSFFYTRGGVNYLPKPEGDSSESQVGEYVALQKSQERVIRAYFLIAFVNAIRYRHCMDPRDKVFAAIGLANHIFPPGCEADVFLIRYDVSVESIYETFATWLLKSVPLMNLLSMVEEASERNLQGLPSWVPDWTVTKSLRELTNEMTVKGGFSKPAGTFHRVSTVEGNQILHVVGSRIEVIDRVDLIPVTGILPLKHQHLRVLSEFCRDMNLTYPSGEGRVEALWRTLVMNTSYSNPSPLVGRRRGVAQESLGSSFRSLILSMVTMRVLHIFDETPVSGNVDDVLEVPKRTIGEILVSEFGIEQYNSGGNHSQDILPSKHEVISRVYQCLSIMGRMEGSFTAFDILASADNDPWRFLNSLRTTGRRLFRTKDGWIGLAPRSTKIDDEVWTFKESHISYILRPHHAEAGTYIFVGEAYMHGATARGEPQDHQWKEVGLV